MARLNDRAWLERAALRAYRDAERLAAEGHDWLAGLRRRDGRWLAERAMRVGR